MQAYAELLSLPLLIAWKPRRLGFWLLIDPCHAKVQGDKSVINLEIACKNNLLSAVAGDFALVPKVGAELYFDCALIKRLSETSDTLNGVFEVVDAGMRDADGSITTDVSHATFMFLMSCMEEVVTRRSDGGFRWALVTQGGTIFAQQVLRTAVAMASPTDGGTKWRQVASDLGSYLTLHELHAEIGQNFGKFVQFQLFQRPQIWPDFLPTTWREM
jgi:hypothetical protein